MSFCKSVIERFDPEVILVGTLWGGRYKAKPDSGFGRYDIIISDATYLNREEATSLFNRYLMRIASTNK